MSHRNCLINYQESLVLVSPFELDHDGFAGQVVEEGFWVHGHHTGHFECSLGGFEERSNERVVKIIFTNHSLVFSEYSFKLKKFQFCKNFVFANVRGLFSFSSAAAKCRYQGCETGFKFFCKFLAVSKYKTFKKLFRSFIIECLAKFSY